MAEIAQNPDDAEGDRGAADVVGWSRGMSLGAAGAANAVGTGGRLLLGRDRELGRLTWAQPIWIAILPWLCVAAWAASASGAWASV